MRTAEHMKVKYLVQIPVAAVAWSDSGVLGKHTILFSGLRWKGCQFITQSSCTEFTHAHDAESSKAQSKELDTHDCFTTCSRSSNHLCTWNGEGVAEKVPLSTCTLKDVLTAAEICFNHGNGFHEQGFCYLPGNMRHAIPCRKPQWDAAGGVRESMDRFSPGFHRKE